MLNIKFSWMKWFKRISHLSGHISHLAKAGATESRRQNLHLQILKNLESRLYHIENSKTRGQIV